MLKFFIILKILQRFAAHRKVMGYLSEKIVWGTQKIIRCSFFLVKYIKMLKFFVNLKMIFWRQMCGEELFLKKIVFIPQKSVKFFLLMTEGLCGTSAGKNVFRTQKNIRRVLLLIYIIMIKFLFFWRFFSDLWLKE